MNIVPDVIKSELFLVPEIDLIGPDASVDPDMLRYYLLYKCHTKLGDEANDQGSFKNLIRVFTQNHLTHIWKVVALNVLGLCYMEKEDYLRSYICFRRAMGIRPMLLVEKWSTFIPWHLAVLAPKSINR
ncbi:hypothetical protein ACJMK2_032664 [Sinanodonta woodiana]|uniref:Uncharacterized protein n=1 Tax=Sinanodonta woodiana TaxID=1069815 RepID=A0ABD3X3X9_SINWO